MKTNKTHHLNDGNNITTRKMYMKNEYESKNELVYQNALLITLLNRYCSITLEKPAKESIITATMPKVTLLHFKKDDINLTELAENQTTLLIKQRQNDYLKEKSLERRKRKNRIIFIQNILIDLLLEKDYFFESKLSKKSEKTFQFERIQKIFHNGKILMHRNQILQKGKSINAYLLQLSSSHSLRIDTNNIQLQKFLLEPDL